MLTYDQLKSKVVVAAVAGVILFFTGCGAHVYHQVRSDETLYSISWRYNQDYRQIAEWNGIQSPYVIHEGVWLRVAPPRGEATVRTAAPASPIVASTTSGTVDHSATSVAPRIKKQPDSNSLVLRTDVSWIWPAKGTVVAKFKASSPGSQGIDISAPLGAPVYAAAAGKVVYSGNGLRGYGNLIIIKHNDKYLSAYGHTQEILAKEGAQVKQGDLIARVGNSESERVKLHFQIRIDGKPVDPLRYLR